MFCGQHHLCTFSLEQHKVGVNHKTRSGPGFLQEGKDLCWTAGFATDQPLQFVGTALHTDVAFVVVLLTLMQLIWLSGFWIGMVYSVECQGRWPRKIILNICITFFFTIYCVSLPTTLHLLSSRSKFSCFSVEEEIDVPTMRGSF